MPREPVSHPLIIYLKILFIFQERGREGERGREISMCKITSIFQLVASCTPPTRDMACNPSMCPNWESNW